MFQRLIDDFKESTGTALRLTSLAAAAALALLVTTAFLCAAAFVFVLEKYGPVQACLTGAAIFFVVTLIAAGSYMVRKRQIEARAEQAAKMAKSTAKPMMISVEKAVDVLIGALRGGVGAAANLHVVVRVALLVHEHGDPGIALEVGRPTPAAGAVDSDAAVLHVDPGDRVQDRPV